MGLRSRLIATLLGVILLPMLLFPVAGIHRDADGGSYGAQRFREVAFLVLAVSIAFTCCAVVLTRIITRHILQPLKELTAAADLIMKGRLDFRISPGRQDEMGRFSAVFELMRARLQESMASQQAYEQARKELIAGISHDLRTPLTSIKGYVEGLQDGIVQGDKAKHERYLAVIKDKTGKLDELIEDLFRFSQLESGQLTMQFADYACAELLDDILRPIELEYTDRAVRLTVVRPFPAGYLRADRIRLTQVFDNLIGNAAAYAGGGAAIAVAATAAAGRLEVAVADNGTAIAEKDLPYLFDRFYRSDKSRSSYSGGAGLGLAICRHIVEAHGGEIGVRALPGEGNRFVFALPLLDK